MSIRSPGRNSSSCDHHRRGFSLVELFVALGIIFLLAGLTIPAVQRARDASFRVVCANNLRQMGLALHNYHDLHQSFPPGCASQTSGDPFPYMSWQTRLLPFLEQEGLWELALQAFQQDANFTDNPPHVDLATTLSIFGCPSDGRVAEAQVSRGLLVAFTSYQGVEGESVDNPNGVLYLDSRVRLADITDGTSNTLMVGERPPSADLYFGWWYAGHGQALTGSCDEFLGVREVNVSGVGFSGCVVGPYHFDSGRASDQCDQFHFWSLHADGANFMLADGSVHFLSYDVDPLLPALASRAGGEGTEIP
jgi:prepilin-type processing-associated H-X9-DG protein